MSTDQPLPALCPMSWVRSPAVRQACLLLALGALMYLVGLGTRDLWYPDEPDVAEPVREMWLRGDWVTPTQNGVAWVDYPIMIYWLALTTTSLAGQLHEYLLRLPSALAAITLALAAWRFGRGRLAPLAGVAGGAVLLTMPHFAYQATNIHPDMVFACAQGVGLMLYAAAESRTAGTAWAMRIAAFLAFAAAFLAKGPLGLLLPGFVLTLWHLSYRQWSRVLLLAPLALVTLAAVAPWYLALGHANGYDFVWREFLAQNFQRFGSGSNRGHTQPWHYYFGYIWGDVGLWSVLVPGALAWRFKSRIWADPTRRLLWLWFVALFAFFTVASTKREAYLLPAYAALALLIGDLAATALAGQGVARRHLRALGWIGTAVAGLIAVAAALAIPLMPSILPHLPRIDPELHPLVLGLRPALAALVLVAAGAAAWGWLALRAQRDDRVLQAAVGLHAGAWLVLMLLVMPNLDPVKSYREPGAWIAAHVPAGAELGFYSPGQENTKRCGFLYYGGRTLRFFDQPLELTAWLDAEPGRLAVVSTRVLRTLPDDPQLADRERHRFGIGRSDWVVWGGRK